MAIAGTTLVMNERRDVVIVLGTASVDETPFVERKLRLEPATLDGLTDPVLSRARGIIISEPAGKFRTISDFLFSSFHRASELGVRVSIHDNSPPGQASDNNITSIARIREVAFGQLGLRPSAHPKVWVGISRHLNGVAEEFARHNPGPPLGNPDLIYADYDTKLPPETELLLKRAFHDCSSVAIEPLSGGKTAKATLRLHATLADEQFGKQAMPFFFKHGNLEEIATEKKNYRTWAEQFIPFHLRPALNEDRSVSTLTEAALVGNFVEGGTSLKSALRSGQGTGGIFSLFEVTLRGLRAQGMRTVKASGAAHRFLRERVKANEIVEHYQDRISMAQKFGFKRDVLHLEQFILQRAETLETHQGMAHGDCHAGNVLMRLRDAVVIDFGSMECLPLSVDPAILEVSLVFGTDKGDDPRFLKDWKKLVRALYIENAPEAAPQDIEEHARLAWLLKAIRELRHIVACNCTTDVEHRLILAGTLIRFARLFPSDLKGGLLKFSEKKRAYALVVAQHLCNQLQ